MYVFCIVDLDLDLGSSLTWNLTFLGIRFGTKWIRTIK